VPTPAYLAAARQCSGVACTGEDLGLVDMGSDPCFDIQGPPWRSSSGIAARACRASSRCSEHDGVVEKRAWTTVAGEETAVEAEHIAAYCAAARGVMAAAEPVPTCAVVGNRGQNSGPRQEACRCHPFLLVTFPAAYQCLGGDDASDQVA
jgi:hypothetical protein